MRGHQDIHVEMYNKGLNISSGIQERGPNKERDFLGTKQLMVTETTGILDISKQSKRQAQGVGGKAVVTW